MFRVNGLLFVHLSLLFAVGAILIYFHVKQLLVYSCNCREPRKTHFSENTGLGIFKDSAHLISLFCWLIDRKERPNCSLTLKTSLAWCQGLGCLTAATRGGQSTGPTQLKDGARFDLGFEQSHP